jgi:hypothetical protein
MLTLTEAMLAFAPMHGGRADVRSPSRGVGIRMLQSPLEIVAAPLRKFEGPGVGAVAATSSGNILAELPIEVIGLFALLVIVAVAGLLRSSGALSDSAPTVGLGDSRDQLMQQAQESAREEIDNMSQGEQEKTYFKEIRKDLASKRGGDKSKRKKRKK